MTLTRRLLTVVLVVVGGVLVLVVLALAALQTPWGRNYVRTVAERQASSALGADVTIAGLRGSLLYGVTIDRLAVTDDGRDIVSARGVSATYDAFDFLRGTFALEEIVIDSPVVYADALELLGPDEPTDPRPEDARSFSIGRIVVRDGLVLTGRLPARVEGVEIPEVLREVQAELSVDFSPETTEVSVAHLSFVAESPEVLLERLSGTVTIHGEDLVLDDIDLQLAESAMRVSGTIDNFRNLGGTDVAAGGKHHRGAVADADRRR